MQKTLIIGATSGIGRTLALQYAASGHLVGATGRRLDLLIYNAGWGEPMEALDAAVDTATVDINVNGFLAAIHYGWRYFTAQGHGHLVTVSSIAGSRGNRYSPAYSAAKAFQSTYFEGLYIKAKKMKIPLYVTDIQPGFVDTKMAKGPRFWVAPVDKAARQIVRAIEHKRRLAYITRRWWLVAKLFRWIPGWIYYRIG
jgi:short-subunit dehydrogenase